MNCAPGPCELLDVNGQRRFIGLLLDKARPSSYGVDVANVNRSTHWHWAVVIGEELKFFDVCDWTPIPIEPVEGNLHS